MADKKTEFIVLIAAFVLIALFCVWQKVKTLPRTFVIENAINQTFHNSNGTSGSSSNTGSSDQKNGITSGLITISLPASEQKISSPLEISGTVDIASALNVQIVDDDSHILGQGIINISNAREKFDTQISYNPPSTNEGAVIFYLMNSNQQYNELLIPIIFNK